MSTAMLPRHGAFACICRQTVFDSTFLVCTRQAFTAAKQAADALATAVDSAPASVFLTLAANNVHGQVTNIAILGPTQAPAGTCFLHASSEKGWTWGSHEFLAAPKSPLKAAAGGQQVLVSCDACMASSMHAERYCCGKEEHAVWWPNQAFLCYAGTPAAAPAGQALALTFTALSLPTLRQPQSSCQRCCRAGRAACSAASLQHMGQCRSQVLFLSSKRSFSVLHLSSGPWQSNHRDLHGKGTAWQATANPSVVPVHPCAAVMAAHALPARNCACRSESLTGCMGIGVMMQLRRCDAVAAAADASQAAERSDRVLFGWASPELGVPSMRSSTVPHPYAGTNPKFGPLPLQPPPVLEHAYDPMVSQQGQQQQQPFFNAVDPQQGIATSHGGSPLNRGADSLPFTQQYTSQLQGNASLPQPFSTLASTQPLSGKLPERQQPLAPVPGPAEQPGNSSAAATQLYAINMQFNNGQVSRPSFNHLTLHENMLVGITASIAQ